MVTWLLGKGEETLAKHQQLSNTLSGITRQESDFLNFFRVATVSEILNFSNEWAQVIYC